MTTDFGRMAKRLRNLKNDLEDEHREATRTGTRRLRRETRRQIVAATPNKGAGAPARESVARNVLHKDVRQGKRPEDAAILAARRVHLPEWAKYVDKGTGPRGEGPYQDTAFPPIGNIKEWAASKPIQLEHYDSYDDVAWAIADTISELGTFPHPFIDAAWNGPRGYRNIVNENRQAMKRAVRRL